MGDYSNSYGTKLGGLSATNPVNGLNTNGFFQNTCFENRSSSSCDTLKSVEIAKTNGKNVINGTHHDDEHCAEEEEDEDEESDTELEDEIDDDESLKTPTHLQSYATQPRPGLVSARIKSLLSKNLQTVNKRPTVRSSLVGNASNFKNSKLLRTPLKSTEPPKLTTNSNNTTINTTCANHTDVVNFSGKNTVALKPSATGDSSENEAQITVHKATVHANHMLTNSMNERTNINDQ